MFWNNRTTEEKEYAKKKKNILQEIEKFFNLEKNLLVRSHMPTDRLVETVCNGSKRTKESKIDFLKFLRLEPNQFNLEKLEGFLKNYQN